MKALVIAEKPSVGRDIARVLGCREKKNGYIEGDKYVVAWAIGHLVRLKMPEEYDPGFKKWRMEDLPVIPDKMQLKPVESTAAQFKIVQELYNRKDIGEVISATDAGREGELIFRYIYELAGCTKPVKRLWISSLTDTAIREGFSRLKPGSEYENLYHAARCRSEADWLVGLNATRAFTVRHRELLSVGRVQTPTLALLVNREKEIRDFVPKDYWEVLAAYREGFTGKWEGDADGRTFEQSKAEAVKKKVEGKTGIITGVKHEEKKEPPPLPYDLTELQRDGNKIYGYSAQQVLDLAQSLYEKKLITYPRTNCRYLSSDIDTLEILLKLKGYSRYTDPVKLQNWSMQARAVNDAKVTDHHALIPTGENRALAGDEARIYDLVARRFIAGFYPEHLFTVTAITVEIEGENFLSRGKTVRQAGWKELYAAAEKEQEGGRPGRADNEGREDQEEQENQEQTLPAVEKGEQVSVQEVIIKRKQTKPPKRYTEATLLSAMENAGKLVDDEELRERMKENGLGTPATRAAILERLLKVGYIERKGKTLYPTPKGMALLEIMPEKLKSPELTGEWEKKLYDIERGKLAAEKYMAEIKQYTKELVEIARESASIAVSTAAGKSIGRCPLCGAGVIRNRKGYGCSAWKDKGCKFFLGKIAGKKLSEKQVRDLLEKGQTKTIKGFTGKRGNKFDAALKIVEGKIEFLFPETHGKS